jgi:hypothetical protein
LEGNEKHESEEGGWGISMKKVGRQQQRQKKK